MKKLYFYLPLLILIGCQDNIVTATVDTPTYSPGTITEITVTNTSETDLLIKPKVTLAPWLESMATDKNLTLNGSLAPQESYTFSFTVDDTEINIYLSTQNSESLIANPTSGDIQISADNMMDVINPEVDVDIPENASSTATLNVPVYSPGTTTEITVTNTSETALLINPKVTLASWLEGIATDQNLTLDGYLEPEESYTFSFTVSDSDSDVLISRENYQFLITNPTSGDIQVSADNLADVINPELSVIISQDPSSLTLLEDVLTNADLWSDTPEIMSATYDFEGIVGVEEGESNVIAAGGAWESVSTPDASYEAMTTAKTPSQVSLEYGYPTYFADSISVTFSWPVLPSTVNANDFVVALSNGETVTPYAASISPNFEFNERSVVTLVGEFGNRLSPEDADAVYPTEVTIVENLELVGPFGPVSAVNLSQEITNPYTTDGGPTLIAAKLSVMNDVGEGIGSDGNFSNNDPNGGTALYGSDAQYRLRLYTTGNFSPDGVAAVLPTDFSNFFQIVVVDFDVPTLLTHPDIPYTFSEGTITIVGLADLGAFDTPLNDAYTADSDNYIDIILKGDEAAMRLITSVEIPASGDYLPFYNPGGPGNNPTPGVTYTSPGPATSQPVTMALDDPLTVNYP